MTRYALLIAGVVILAIVGSAEAGHKKSGNQGQLYRLPWIEGWTSYRSGYGPAGSSDHGAGTIDFQFDFEEPVKALADGYVSAEGDAYCSGIRVDIDHTITDYPTRRSRYLHLNREIVGANQFVAQGQVIGYAGNSGSEDNYTPPSWALCSDGVHLHFDLLEGGTSISWGAGGIGDVTAISQRAANDFVSAGNVELSNNAGAAMWGGGGTNLSQPFLDRYYAGGGWRWHGSASRMEPGWDICPASGNIRPISGCPSQFGDLHVQTFRAPAGDWRQAMVGRDRAVDGPPHWIMVAFYTEYTNLDNQPSNRKEWSWWIGAPTGPHYQPFPDPNILRQNFEGGFMYWHKTQCLIQLYNPSGNQLDQRTSSLYCDGGGPVPGPGSIYGSGGD